MILLVEDNPAHAELIKRALSEHRQQIVIHHVSDGEAALDFLFHSGRYRDIDPPRPSIILLDLRLPRVDGLEVLRVIKTDADLKQIPVIILSTSRADEDLTRAYAQYANSYLVKPVQFSDFSDMMRAVRVYWLNWNQKID